MGSGAARKAPYGQHVRAVARAKALVRGRGDETGARLVRSRVGTKLGSQVGVLASFAHPGPTAVFLLKTGINRIGNNEHLGDFERTDSVGVIEARQFLILMADQPLVVGDHYTGESYLLKSSANLPADKDPRSPKAAYFHYMVSHGAVETDVRDLGLPKLDWHGDALYTLCDEDVILGQYQALAFCRWRE